MKLSSMPLLVAVPFADQGTKNAIPVESQIGITDGAASFTDGFPPLTMTPVVAGGIPPAGGDFNGILNAITQSVRWACAGGQYKYDDVFSTTVGGYPKGAMIQNPAGDVIWLNTVDDNNTNPDNGTGWIPAIRYGLTNIALAGSNVTLTPSQAAKETITLTGTLTANVQVIMPAWVETWLIINNTTGGFVVSVKTASGSGVNLAAATSSQIYGDGTNIYYGALMVKNNFAEIKAAGTNSQAAARGNIGCGTAATHDVTESPADSTAGRVLKTGDFGLGGFLSALSATNVTGFFSKGVGDAANPEPSQGYAHINLGVSGSYKTELAIGYTQAPRAFCRSYLNNVPTAWVELIGSNGGTVAGSLTVNGTLTAKGGVEVYGATPYIDFHFGNATGDFTSRIIETVSGKLSFLANVLFTKSVEINADGELIKLKNNTLGNALYIIARDADGTNKWYVGNGGNGSDNLTLSNYKAANAANTITFHEDGHVSIANFGGYAILNVDGAMSLSDYKYFDNRYNAKYVQNIQLGAQTNYTLPGGNESSWTYDAPAGCVLTGIVVQDTGQSSADNIGGVHVQPIQKNINGTWTTIAG
ncbi:hypothetical protein Q0A17_04115 [Citrobacter sp. S2-9]|uniref:Tail fibre protein gp37 trimerization region domain-containing protein n=1 Tax=Citrobacter enshiensis TaxID=2971264 RepID=A0ABT8PR79_9ENTR|nr:hypothetical protein [Citrobacter enshiensis]MDN8598607.1 hypothetical protein [Citrobacter enshiensis]